MGRTGRYRKRKSISTAAPQTSLDNEPKIIKLKKWLSHLGWKNHSKLKLTHFENSGRGLSSSIRISPNDKLISIPCRAMITYVSFEFTEVYDVVQRFPLSFTTEEAFTMFLSLEKHKNEKSQWKVYIDSLPEVLPVMPWRCTREELALVPEDILPVISKYFHLIQNSFKKLCSLLKSEKFLCSCCGSHLYEVITKHTFYESYVLFLTRCVYLHYKHLKQFSRRNIETLLLDEPSMVLCPLLDMFNHSTEADAELQFQGDKNSCFLHIISKHSFSKRSQLYFAYGNHDNLSLFCYYGFYLPTNTFDFIAFTRNDIEFLTFSKDKWAFVHEKKLDENLVWHLKEPSFNLVAIGYISTTKDVEWKTKVYSEDFNYHDQQQIWFVLRQLLQKRICRFSDNITQMESLSKPSESLRSTITFCKHRVEVMKNMLSNTFEVPIDVHVKL